MHFKILGVAVRSLGEVGHTMYYVYIIKLNNSSFYVGFSKDYKKRLKKHQQGSVESTRPYLPCKLISVHCFKSKKLAIKFEGYLKTGSGIAFRNKHFI